MQKAADRGVVVKSAVDGVGGEHDRERQVAAGNAFGQAQEIGADAGLFMREEGAGAAAADGDFVADQVHFVAVAQCARQSEIFRVVHEHAAGALNERFDDQRGNVFVMPCQMGFERLGRAAGNINRCFAVFGLAGIRRRHGGRGADERGIGIAENRHVGHRQCADRFAVVAAGEAKEIAFFVAATIAPAVEGHLERDLGRRSAVGGVETMAERPTGQGGQALRQFDRRLVREAGEHDVFQRVELFAQGAIDARVAVAEEIDPPRTDAVEVAIAVKIVQPRALATGDRDQRQVALVLLHLRARMPDGGEAALQQIGVAHCPVKSTKNQCRVCDGALLCSGNSACTVSPSALG